MGNTPMDSASTGLLAGPSSTGLQAFEQPHQEGLSLLLEALSESSRKFLFHYKVPGGP